MIEYIKLYWGNYAEFSKVLLWKISEFLYNVLQILKKNVTIIITAHKSLPVGCYFILEQTIKKESSDWVVSGQAVSPGHIYVYIAS